MPNQLKMSKIQSVLALRQQGWPFTRIARELGIHRETVARYVRRAFKTDRSAYRLGGPKPTQAPTGSGDSKPTEAPRSPPADGSGRSDCEPLRDGDREASSIRDCTPGGSIRTWSKSTASRAATGA